MRMPNEAAVAGSTRAPSAQARHLPLATVPATPAAHHLSEQLALVSQPIRLWRE